MNRTELIGGVLNASADPDSAAELLYEALRGSRPSGAALSEQRLEPALIDIAARVLGSDDDAEVLRWCRAGAAWVQGRRSSPAGTQSWEVVITYPAGLRLPEGTERTTGETVISMINGARTTVRIVAPFVDQQAIEFLADAIGGAATRGAMTTFVLTRSARSLDASAYARERFSSTTPAPRLRFASEFGVWPHLKVVLVDSTIAYVGSANLTGAALAGRNLELGVLLRGSEVARIERVLDRIVLEPE